MNASATDRSTARLLADVGGTNARFAWQAGRNADITDLQVLPAADFATLADAMRYYLDRLGRGCPAQAAIAIANPIVGDQVRMTNHHWSFSIATLQAQFGLARLRVLNDFTALALALPSLGADERRQVGGSTPATGAAVALIGPGTGLGVSGLLPDGHGGWVPIQGEGGHATLAGRTPREHAVLQQLEALHGHASAERAVSGAGLADIHGALWALDTPPGAPRAAKPALAAADIVAGAVDRGDAGCCEAVELFCAFLGTAAGNLALTLGARGGVYIGGGIVPRLGRRFDQSAFRARFESKGRFANYLQAIPVYVIVANRSPALLGAARALDLGVS